jgi:uncharacterized phosphosugar-binding protein
LSRQAARGNSTHARPAARRGYLAAARGVLDAIEKQGDEIERAARVCAGAIEADGLVHLFGTGHSRIPVEEMFPRYGSYPGFHPIVELSMTFHTQVVGANGQRQAMFIERVEGLAETILANFELRPPDAMIVFSASGLTAVPIEMAMGARRRGLAVVAVTSVAQSLAGEPTHSSRSRLLDHADVVLDLGTPAGDAMTWIDGLETPVGPGSTLAAVALAKRNQGSHRRAARCARRHAAGAHERQHRRSRGVSTLVRRRLRRVCASRLDGASSRQRKGGGSRRVGGSRRAAARPAIAGIIRGPRARRRCRRL